MRRDELIKINAFPTVVQAAGVRELRRLGASTESLDFVAGYLGFDGRARHALTETVTALAQRERGGAFWLNGVFGCGKSHLLGLLALLSDGVGHQEFAGNHPFLGPLLNCIPRRLVVHFSLDDYDAAHWGLEAVFWKEVRTEWDRQGHGNLNLDLQGSRAETFAAFEELSRERGLQGLTVCIDELSLFLGGRDHHGLQSDAAFLQFLGQHSRRSSLCIFAALQKNVEDITGLEFYSLSQIRDRYTTLSLSLANLPAIVEHRLVRVLDESQLDDVCAASWADHCRSFPLQEFGPRDWRAAYPFHPSTLFLVEQVVSRFFSRTRSAVIFCAAAVDGTEPASARVMPDSLFDYVEPEFESHPDLRPLANVWESWREGVANLAPRENEAGDLLRVMKLLLLCKVGGVTPTPIQVANSLMLDAGLSGDGNYQYARHLLEKLRTKAAFLAVERADDPLQDRYAVDTGQRVGEMLRRHLQSAMDTLEPQDGRIPATVLESCRDEPLPLAEMVAGPRSYSLFWQNAPRRVLVEIWTGTGQEAVPNRVSALCEPGSPDDALLLVQPPFGQEEMDPSSILARLDPEAHSALWFWKPRSALKDEVHLAREVAAAVLLEGDPQLQDNRKGRAVLEKLKSESPGRIAQLQRVALRLLREGTVWLGQGQVVEASELAGSDNWTSLLEAIGDFSFPHLFPNYSAVAPRARLLTPSNSDALCLEILRRPTSEPYFAPSLERLARHIGEPLGVASAAAGRWKISAPEPQLNSVVMSLVTEGRTFASLEAHLSKRPWGLRAEQTAVAVCSLLRAGELVALDSQGQELIPSRIGLPLRRSVHFLRLGRLVSGEVWGKVCAFVKTIGGDLSGPVTFEAQEKGRLQVLEARERIEAELNLSLARAAQLRRQLGHGSESWENFEGTCATLSRVLECIPAGGTAIAVLEAAGSIDLSKVVSDFESWRDFANRLEVRLYALLTAHALLSHVDLVCPEDLAEERGTLLVDLSSGEAVLRDETLLDRLAAWAEAYRQQYAAWHAAQHQPERWNSLNRLGHSNFLRGMERLAELRNRPIEAGRASREIIDIELQKQCGRNAPLGSGEAVCVACGLRFGVRVALSSPGEIEVVLEGGLDAVRSLLREPQVLEYLSRHAPDWLRWDGGADSLLGVATEVNIAHLEQALQPRRRVQRRWGDLLSGFDDCRTRREYETQFAHWLDAGENVSPEDVVTLVN